MVSFQLFVLECLKVQDTLRKMYIESCEKYPIKLEDDVVDYVVRPVKEEVSISNTNIVCLPLVWIYLQNK